MIIIINGSSGAGKSFLLSHLKDYNRFPWIPIKKYTTRYPRHFERNFESDDLYYGCSNEKIDSLAYNYEYYGYRYGICKQELEEEINKNNIPVIIVRSFETIKQIKKDFNETICLFIIGANGSSLKDVLDSQGRSKKEIEQSNKKIITITEEYTDNIGLIDYCLNNTLYNQELLFNQLINIVKIYRNED